MRTNPMVKPQISSGWAVTLTVISCVCLTTGFSTFVGKPAAWVIGLLFVAVSVILGGSAATIWRLRIRRTNAWISDALAQWQHLYTLKNRLGVTTEVTVLDIDYTDPIGAWATLRWEHFSHVQRAWVEALPDEIWRGAVLLISPDPAQIHVHGPWPDIYYLLADAYHTYAAAAAIPYLANPKYYADPRVDASNS